MPAKPRFPTHHEPTIEVRPALGRFDDFAAVVGVQRTDARGCWCMAYRDSRVPARERPQYMRVECASDPGPGVLVYVDDVVAGWCSIAPRGSYRRLLNSRTIPVLDHRDAWTAVCFVVRAGYRNHGLMHHLLAGAVHHATVHGADVSRAIRWTLAAAGSTSSPATSEQSNSLNAPVSSARRRPPAAAAVDRAG